ncbi:F-box/LRR-repeat protein 2-like [Aphidius gifuensis]|uniref:F-box/LRR-repeat protein 2-like n=1 Tax=Aphidius gifuensis TaxID=684658 RepID=UPI001CDC4EE9|nr:F-box/LRR-repeat protein 2-like [Aphidius gifuensis]
MSMNKIPDLMDKRKSIDDDFEDEIMDLDYDSLKHIFMCLTVPERIVMENVLPKWKQASRRSGYSVKEHKCDVSIDDDFKNRLLTLSFNLNKYKNLQSLTIRSCNLDDIIQDISKKSTLVYLDIRGSWALEKSWIFNDLVNLEHIDLLDCCMIAEQSISNVFSRIVDTCKNLKHVELLACINNPNDLQHIPEPAITPENCLTITAKSEAAAIIKLTELENLECLKLYKQKLTKESIIAISNNCKKLKYLKIPYCKVTSTDRHERLSCPFFLDDLSKLQYLEYLDLSCIRKLQDSTIILIADKCKNLKYLKIKGRNELTENAFDALTSLKNLQKLAIDDNMAVTNNFVKKLKGLRFLNLRNCINLTDASIIQVIENCPDLERLTLSFIDNITLDTIIAADLATKNRINDIVLHIRIDDQTLYETANSKIESQWLLVEYSHTL